MSSPENVAAAVRQYEEVLRAGAAEAAASLTPQEHLVAITTAAANVLGLSAPPAAAEEAKKGEAKKPVRGYLDGCFDIMHSGHYNALRQARMLCDVLVVGVHSDAEISACKGPPVMNDSERKAMVEACKWADEVVFGTPYSPTIELLDELNCDFCIHGDDMATSATGEDAYGPMKAAGRMRVVKRTEGVSTTDLVGRLLLMTKNHHVPDAALSHSPSLSGSAAAGAPPLPELSELPPSASDMFGASSSGMSTFLPTTWRISQFSSHRQPQPGDRIVYIDGAFDLFHVAHVEVLEQARALGDFLYVGVHSDEVVNRHKGRNYPIMNLHERVLNVLSCKFVDEVVIGAPWDVNEDLLRTLNISVVVRGGVNKNADEITDEPVSERNDPYRVAKAKGIFKQLAGKRNLSTTAVVGRIIQNRLAYEERNSKRGKKEADYLKNREFVAEK